MSGEPMPMWKKIATFDSSNYFSSDIKILTNSDIVTTDKGDKLFVGLGTTSNGVLLQSNDLSNTSPISWTKSLFIKNNPFDSQNSMAIDKYGSNIYIAPTGSALRYNNKSGHSKSWNKSINITDVENVATSGNGKSVYIFGERNDVLGIYSSKSLGKGHWTREFADNGSAITTITMNDKGDNIYFGTRNSIIWRNNNNHWTKVFQAQNPTSMNLKLMATNSSGKSVYAYDSSNNRLYYAI